MAVVEKLRSEYPQVPSRLIVTGEPPYPNAKVYSLDRMLAEARHDLLVMSDSDIRVTPGHAARASPRSSRTRDWAWQPVPTAPCRAAASGPRSKPSA